MSGGSFDYLCFKDCTEIGQHKETLKMMADRLSELGYTDKYAYTILILEKIKRHEQELQSLLDIMSEVWRSVEWFDSGDYGKDQLDEIIKNHKP